jgi:hypothetical protein
MYVLFAIHLDSRRVHVLGVTKNADSASVTQQACNLVAGEGVIGIRFLIRDRDSKFPARSMMCSAPEGVTDRQDPDPGTASERARRAVGPHDRRSAWTGCSYSAGASWIMCFGSTPRTTTGEAASMAWLTTPDPQPGPALWPATARAFERAGSSTSTTSRLEFGSGVCVCPSGSS